MRPITGMRAFLLIWVGQVISLVGTSMTQFALPIWAWEKTGQATALALVAFFNFAPQIILSPLAGALVDRWNRKLMMMISDLAAGVMTIMIFLLHSSGNLDIWHLYVAGAVTGAFQTFQWPAYSAAISTMLPQSQYGRAFGLITLAEFGSQIVAPLMAAVLLVSIGLSGVLLIDIITFSAAITMLMIVTIPQPEITEEGRAGQGSLWKESIYGFQYIWARPSLLGLQLVFFMINMVGTFGGIVVVPMILSRTDNDKVLLGTVNSIGAVGGVVGAVLLSVWGGPKRRVDGVLMGMILSSLLGTALLGLGREIIVWSVASFMTLFFMPVLNGSNQAIWQSKVAPDVQGRVFSARRMIAQMTIPISMLLAGPAADKVFEPAMMPGGALADVFGWMVGTGAGAGMSLMVVLTGLAGVLVGMGGYAFPVIRDAEKLLPDHAGLVKSEPATPAEGVPAEAMA